MHRVQPQKAPWRTSSICQIISVTPVYIYIYVYILIIHLNFNVHFIYFIIIYINYYVTMSALNDFVGPLATSGSLKIPAQASATAITTIAWVAGSYLPVAQPSLPPAFPATKSSLPWRTPSAEEAGDLRHLIIKQKKHVLLLGRWGGSIFMKDIHIIIKYV